MKKLPLHFCFLLSVFLLICLHFASFAQTAALSRKLLRYKLSADSITEKYAREKIYVQSDKPYYIIGDTIWFKAYVFDATSQFFSTRSGLLHIDFIDEEKQITKQYLFPITGGLSWGNITLDKQNFKTGNYVMRAYTNWMRNFGSQVFFYKNIAITGQYENSWLVNSNISTSIISDKECRVAGKLRLTTPGKIPVADSAIKLEVTGHNKSFYSQAVKTDASGTINLNFNLPLKADDWQIILKNHNNNMVIPLTITGAEKADVQFLPEGGDLVAGLNTRIGFKAVGIDGKGIDINGTIIDQNGKQVATFKSAHKGMGSFQLLPQANEVYTAKVNLGGGLMKDYPLPAVKLSATTLTVSNGMLGDSVKVTVSATNDLVEKHGNYCLVARSSGGIVCYAAVISFKKNNQIRLSLSKNVLPAGIVHFLLMNTEEQPLNERAVFIDRHDDLRISISPDRAFYLPKESVRLNVKVSDAGGIPVRGDFSLAITDNAQVSLDSLTGENILTRMLLTADLKGHVEEPGYYFQNNVDSWQALDNLLLTQGWVRYEPAEPKVIFPPETEYTLTGRVNNAFYKPIRGTDVKLLSKSPLIVMDTLTNEDGQFTFHHFPRVDTPVFVLKAVNKKGRSGNTSITIDETPPPEPVIPEMPLPAPWYLNSDSTLINNLKSDLVYREQQYNPTGSHVLKEVTIKAKRTINGSHNINGSGNADVVLDEKFLEQQGKKDWLQLLESNVKNFYYNYHTIFPPGRPPITYEWFFVGNNPVIFVIDGTLLTNAVENSFIAIKHYLQTHDAEDIKGIEVMYSAKYVTRYSSHFNFWEPFFVTYIEITTRSGRGPIISNTAGMYLYKPLPVSWPKQFYKPKYNVTDTSRLTDLRSTIDWEPNVITDNTGCATISFYSGNIPSTYTAIIEGTDLKGAVGYGRRKITINTRATAKSK